MQILKEDEDNSPDINQKPLFDQQNNENIESDSGS